MAKLNQILAVEKGAKARAGKILTLAYHTFQKPGMLNGISRSYRPLDDGGEQLPPESTLVQMKVTKLIDDVVEHLTDMFNVVAAKDEANTRALADVVVDDVTILLDVPATYLLFLEKQLVDLMTFITSIPVLDPTDRWHFEPAQDVYATDPAMTNRSKKVPRNHVKAPATDKHPAQVELYYEDVPVGQWTTIKFSGALPASRVNDLVDRIEKLQRAVKFAREEANTIEVVDQGWGGDVLGYLFAP